MRQVSNQKMPKRLLSLGTKEPVGRTKANNLNHIYTILICTRLSSEKQQQIDEDHDGFISLDDLTQWLQKVRVVSLSVLLQ